MEGLDFPAEKDDCKRFEKNNVTIALNILKAKKEKIYLSHDSKHKLNCETQVFLALPNGEWQESTSKGQQQCHYLAVKNY